MSDIDSMRIRIWRARSSRSRVVGVSLLVLSAILFVVSFVLADLAAEVASVSSFLVGVALLSYEVEPRVKVYPSGMSQLGPLRVASELFLKQGIQGAATYVPGDDGVSMSFPGSRGETNSLNFSPIGHGLHGAYENELGPIRGKGVDYLVLWLPRTIVDGLGLAEKVKMKRSGDEVETVLTKPFIRPLCVNAFMKENYCSNIGCPLVASVAEALANSAGKPVKHLGCVYDPTTQTAVARHLIVE